MELKGTIIEIKETKQVSEKFKSREFILKTDDTYPQYVSIQLTQDKCSLLDNFKVNQSIKCSLNIRGRRWETPTGEVKYFNTIEAWRIEQEGEQPKTETPKNTKESEPNTDDLPF